MDLARSLKEIFKGSVIGSVVFLKRKITENLYSLFVTHQLVSVKKKRKNLWVGELSLLLRIGRTCRHKWKQFTVTKADKQSGNSLSPVSGAPFFVFSFFCPRCSLGLFLIILPAISLSDSAPPRRLSFAFFIK